MSYIKHKPGGDAFVRHPKWYHGKNRWMNYHGFKIMVGPSRSPFFLLEIDRAIRKQESCIIIWAGAPGAGKSYSAMRIAKMIDKDFDPDRQIVFTSAELLELLAPISTPLHRGQVIMVDEAQFVMGSRNWYENVQRELMSNIQSVRSRGFIILIIALSIDVLDKIVREFILSHFCFQEDRGKFVAYRLWKPRFGGNQRSRRMGTIHVQLPDSYLCSYPTCLTCDWRDVCVTDRARYERKKRLFIEDRSRLSLAKRSSKEKVELPTDEALVQITLAGIQAGRIKINDRKHLIYEDMEEVFRTSVPLKITVNKIRGIRRKIEREHPELFTDAEQPPGPTQ